MFLGLKDMKDIKLPEYNLWYYPYEKLGKWDPNALE